MHKEKGGIRLEYDEPLPKMLLSFSSSSGLTGWKPAPSGSPPFARGRTLKVLLLSVCSVLSIYLFATLYLVPTFGLAFPSEGYLSLLIPVSAIFNIPLSILSARSPPSVLLRQGTVVGKVVADGSLPKSVEAFLGIPYALPPTGDRRFAPPEPVGKGDGDIDASQYGKRCPSRPLTATAEWSEDCLFLNVFRPQQRDHGTKLPVSIFIHGGSYNAGQGRGHNDASMMAWSGEPYVAINFNYRLGALGFPTGAVPAKEGSLNVGLRDQILLLEWVQDNIEEFGGDPDQVTLFGVSAGAHSVGHHILNHRSSKSLFHRAMLESGAPTARAVYPYDAPLPSTHFDEFLIKVNCSNLQDDEIMPCLRSKSSATVAQASLDIYEMYFGSNRWAWQPVIDGETIRQAPIQGWESGNWHKIPILTGFTTNEGAAFVDPRMDTSAAFRDFWEKLIPKLTPKELDTIDDMYPDPLIHPDSPYAEDRPITVGSQFKRVAASYTHFGYVCPMRQTAHYSSQGQKSPVYMYHWALNRTMQGGAGHAEQIGYEMYIPAVRRISPAQKELSGHFHGYLTSFITTGDPNKVRGNYGDRPEWEEFEGRSDGNHKEESVMIFGKGNDERAGGTGTGISSQITDDTWSASDCEFWWDRSMLTQSH